MLVSFVLAVQSQTAHEGHSVGTHGIDPSPPMDRPTSSWIHCLGDTYAAARQDFPSLNVKPSNRRRTCMMRYPCFDQIKRTFYFYQDPAVPAMPLYYGKGDRPGGYAAAWDFRVQFDSPQQDFMIAGDQVGWAPQQGRCHEHVDEHAHDMPGYSYMHMRIVAIAACSHRNVFRMDVRSRCRRRTDAPSTPGR